MSFEIFTDSCANLPEDLVQANRLTVVPLTYFLGEEEFAQPNLSQFDGEDFYQKLRGRTEVRTSLINPGRFIDYAMPALEAGKDLLYVGMSSGISGTFGSVSQAVTELRILYPQRQIEAVDTLAASLGEGILVLSAAKMRDEGLSLAETAAALNREKRKICQVFTVDDLMYLRKGGRLSSLTAMVGMVLQIKPLLMGNEEGKIVITGKVRGRKAALQALANAYAEKVASPETQVVGIAHGGCPIDAKYLADLLRKKAEPKELLVVYYEPVTGSHVGPGTVALFFEGAQG